MLAIAPSTSGAEAVPSVMATEMILAVRDAVVAREQAPRTRLHSALEEMRA